MKTLQLVIIVVFVAAAAAGYSQSYNGKILPFFEQKTLSIPLSLKQAMAIPHLEEAIRSQVNAELGGYETESLYTYRVRMKGVVYVITATYSEWMKFFRAGSPKRAEESRIIG